MTFGTLIIRSLRFHWRAHLGVVLGATVGSAALIGALVVGDSVRESLRERALERLGWVETAMDGGDRFFPQKLAERIVPINRANPPQVTSWNFDAVLKLPGTASRQDGTARANQVNILGVGYWSFWQSTRITNARPAFTLIPKDSVVLNAALAAQLHAEPGDVIVLRLHKPTALSRDVPITPQSDASVALQLKVHGIATAPYLGNFSLRAGQAPPLNAFLLINDLAPAAGLPDKANLILAGDFRTRRPTSGEQFRSWWERLRSHLPGYARGSRLLATEEIKLTDWRMAWQTTLADFSLDLRAVTNQAMLELRSGRIFLEPAIAAAIFLPETNRSAAEKIPFWAAPWNSSLRPPTNEASPPLVASLARPVLTYLANLLAARTNTTPYSMVTAAGPPWTPAEMRDDEILVNQWLAEDLQVKPGDALDLTYFQPESGARLVEATNHFRVRAVVPMTLPWADRTLMPEFPGIAKAESTHDWDAGFPLVHKIRDKDEAYWKQFRGAPKAFVTLAAGQKMWANRFGNLTAIRFPFPTSGGGTRSTASQTSSNEGRTEKAGADFAEGIRDRVEPVPPNAAADFGSVLERTILANLKPEDLGLRFEPVRDQALKAANQGQDFGQLFLGFSFFLIVAALILIALLFQFGLEQRTTEVGTLLALGFTSKQVRRLFWAEGTVLALLGGLAGVAGGLAYARALLRGLTTVWREAVGTSALNFHATFTSLAIGLTASVVVSALTIALVLRQQARRPARELLAGEGAEETAMASLPKRLKPPRRKGRRAAAPQASWTATGPRSQPLESAKEPSHIQPVSMLVAAADGDRPRSGSRARICAIVAALAGFGLLTWAVITGETANTEIFFSAGALLLVAGLAFTSAWLSGLARSQAASKLSVSTLGLRGATRRRKRSLAVAGMLACGSFLIVAIGAFKLDADQNALRRTSGTGGFALLGDSTLPVIRDLNRQAGREFYGLDEAALAGVSFVPMRVHDGDEASCLNLNRAQKPRLLGVNPELLAGRGAFTFAKTDSDLSRARGWQLLNAKSFSASPPVNRKSQIVNPIEVPAIGDQNSIRWALGKNVGDTLDFVNERGQPFKVRLVGAVANSILQGSLLISEDEFVRRFPSESGYRMFLLDAPSNRVAQVSATLTRALQDVGLELTPTARRLAQFNAVQNTYLNTFQILGGLGLLLGSAGLGVVVLRNVLERRGELALLLAVGFRRRALQWLVLSEHAGLLWAGLGVGIVAALVAILPALLAPGSEVHYLSLALTLAGVLASGLLWTWVATWAALRGRLLDALRNE